ncbi:hypothetical protein MalM25_37670 [Planctomycetes bacterium MalM25]|nr:hypothetical protein MalM25_37670 [Planctomycetes bacterium MalM25]
MEAANPKRAALRLAAAAGGVMLTACLAGAALLLLALRPSVPESSPQATPPVWRAESLAASDGLAGSYHLPPEAFTPVHAGPLLAPHRPAPAPVYVEPEPLNEPAEEAIASSEPSTDNAVVGPITIHNPAATGPPEDDSLPPIPTEAGQTPGVDVVGDQPGPAFMASAGKPPIGWEPGGALFDMPGEPLADLASEGLAEEITPPVARPEPPVVDREALLNYTNSTNDLSRRLTGEVRSAFQLGKSGAVYAARSRFVAVLRRIALAKDAEEGSSRHATALAEGLRTLDDADDFVPRGDALEAELDVAAIAASHGLGLVTEAKPAAPHEAIARYSQHAAERLAEAVAGEPSGSMALYGLGKTYTRLEAQSSDPNAGRKSLVMYRAAVDTHRENYLAANELGVRLASAGRYQQAREVLRRAAAQPTAIATVHANLAKIESRLGHAGAAVLSQQQSDQLAQQERAAGDVSRRHGVQWVSPDAFRRADPNAVAYATPPARPVAAPVVYEQPAPPAQPSRSWSGFWRDTKQKLGWSSGAPAPTPYAPATPVASQPQRIVR